MTDLLAAGGPQIEMWATMAALFILGLLIGTAAVVAGVGGGVMFVPLASALFAIHVDFIRGAGLMVALVGAIAAAPVLLQRRLSRARISVPLALAGSAGSILGARIGLRVPENAIMVALGVLMLGVAAQTIIQAVRARGTDAAPDAGAPGAAGDGRGGAEPPVRPSLSTRLAAAWHLSGSYRDPGSGETVEWRTRNIVPAMVLFVGIGMIGGALGVGAGWANVPVLSSLMGLPLKLAAATSGLIIVANSSAAAWIYLREGALDPLIVVPAVTGMIGGTRIGARLLGHARPEVVRVLVIVVLLLAGVRTLWGALA